MENSALRARFDKYDPDHNGKIDVNELGQLLDALGVGFSPEQVRATFESIDVNSSGFIDFPEFAAWWAKH